MKKNIVIFFSQIGSNAIEIYNKLSKKYKIKLVYTNNPDSPATEFFNNQNVRTIAIEDKKFFDNESKFGEIKRFVGDVDLIILAGYMNKVPKDFIDKYPKKIINLHPSLLPKHKGLYELM